MESIQNVLITTNFIHIKGLKNILKQSSSWISTSYIYIPNSKTLNNALVATRLPLDLSQNAVYFCITCLLTHLFCSFSNSRTPSCSAYRHTTSSSVISIRIYVLAIWSTSSKLVTNMRTNWPTRRTYTTNDLASLNSIAHLSFYAAYMSIHGP